MSKNPTRRDFWRWGGGFGLSYALEGWGLSSSGDSRDTRRADMIVSNGRIATQDGRGSFASSVAMKDGRFVAVGSDSEVMRFRSEATEIIDVGGRTVIPGLNDSHMHPIRGGLNYNMELGWDGGPVLAGAMGKVEGQAQGTSAAELVGVGGGWTEFQFGGGRMPALDEINRAGPGTAVFVMPLYGRVFFNGAALRAVG